MHCAVRNSSEMLGTCVFCSTCASEAWSRLGARSISPTWCLFLKHMLSDSREKPFFLGPAIPLPGLPAAVSRWQKGWCDRVETLPPGPSPRSRCGCAAWHRRDSSLPAPKPGTSRRLFLHYFLGEFSQLSNQTEDRISEHLWLCGVWRVWDVTHPR